MSLNFKIFNNDKRLVTDSFGNFNFTNIIVMEGNFYDPILTVMPVKDSDSLQKS